jgi:hypothetical protein
MLQTLRVKISENTQLKKLEDLRNRKYRSAPDSLGGQRDDREKENDVD